MLIKNVAQVLTIAILIMTSAALGADIHDAVKEGNYEAVKELIAADASVVNSGSESGQMPLHIAAGAGDIEMAELLLNNGAQVETVDGRSFTPVLMACMRNQKEMVELLAHHGANLRAEHPVFGSAIVIGYWQECINGKSGLTEFMMSQGVPFDHKATVLGVTMLNLASTFKNIDMARLVIGLGADVNAVSDGRGRSELSFATQCAATEIVDLLIEQGADVNALDADGSPALRPAIERGQLDIVKLLLAAGAATDFVADIADCTLNEA